MSHLGETNENALSCSVKATGRPQACSRRKTLHVVAVASRPLSGMMSCLAPSPAVMSSLATTVTRSELPLTRWIFLVLPSATRAPRGCFAVRRSDIGASTACSHLPVAGKTVVRHQTLWGMQESNSIVGYFLHGSGGEGRPARR